MGYTLDDCPVFWDHFNANSSGKNNRFLHYVIELCEMPGVTLRRVIVDGEYAELSAIPFHGGSFDLVNKRRDGKAYCHMRFYDGSQTDADADLVALFGSDPNRPWTSSHRLAGISYISIASRGSSKVWSGRPNFRFELDGIALYDPRLDSSVGGNGAHRWSDPSTWTHSANPVVMIYSILRGLRLPSGDVFGGVAEVDDLPLPNWVAAMNACDADFEGRTRYIAGLEIDLAQQSPADVISELQETCNAQIAEAGGYWYIQVADPAAPLATISDDNIRVDEARSLTPYPPAADVFNAAKATFSAPDALWNGQELPQITNADWEAEDGERRSLEFQFIGVHVAAQGQQLMSEMLRDERRFRRHVLPMPAEYGFLRPLHSLDWTSAWNGYTDKTFEVFETVTDLRTLLVQLSLRERDPLDFAPLPEFELPDPPVSLGPGALLESGVPGLDLQPWPVRDSADAPRRPGVRWTWITDEIENARGLEFELVVSATGIEVWTGQTLDASRGELSVGPLLPNQALRGRARLLTDLYDANWMPWQTVITDDIRLSDEDFADALRARIDEAYERHDALLTDATGTVAQLRDAIATTFGPLEPTAPITLIERLELVFGPISDIGPIPLVDQLELAFGPLNAPKSLATQIEEQTARLTFEIPRIRDAETALDDIWQRLIDLAEAQFATDARIVDAGVYVDPGSGQVRIAALEATANRVANVEIAVDAANAEIEQRATVAYVNETVSFAVLDPTQIPIVTDLNFRVTTVEQTLSAETGRIDQLVDVLTVNDGIVSMTTVNAALDALGAALQQTVSQTQFDAQTLRIDAAEQSLAILPDGAELRQSVEASRSLAAAQADMTEASIAQMWEQWTADTALQVALAQGVRDLRSTVDELNTAQTTERLQLAASVGTSVARLEEIAAVLATADESLASQVLQLGADLAVASQAIDGQAVTISGQADALNDVSARVAATETGLLSEASDLRLLTARIAETEVQIATQAEEGLSQLWDRWAADQDQRASVAVAFQEFGASVEERVAAEAAERSLLGAAIGAAQASIAEERTTRTSADSALAESIAQLQANLTLTDAGLLANGTAVNALTARVTTSEGLIGVQAQSLLQLGAELTDANLALDVTATAVQDLETRADQTDGQLVAAVADRQVLTARVGAAEAGLDDTRERTLSDAWDRWVGDQDLRDGVATAIRETGASVEERLRAEAFERALLGAAIGSAQASISEERTTRAAADEAVARDVVQLRSDLTDASGEIDASALFIEEVETRTSTAEGQITAQGQSLQQLQSGLTGTNAAVAANAAGLASLTTQVTQNEYAIDAQSAALLQLQSDLAGTTAAGDATAAAVDTLTTRVTDAEGAITSQGEDLTQLRADLTGVGAGVDGNAAALDTLDARVTATENTAAAQAGDLTQLQADLTNTATLAAGTASGLSALDARVDQTEAGLASQASDLQQLEASLADTGAQLGLTASGLQSLTTRVSDAEGVQTTQGQQLTQLQSDLADAASGNASTAAAVGSLTTRVDQTEADIASQATSLQQVQTNLSNVSLGVDAVAAGLNSIEARVGTTEGQITAQNQLVQQLQSGLTAAEGNTTANADAVDTLTTRVAATEADTLAQGQAITSLEATIDDPTTGLAAAYQQVIDVSTVVDSQTGQIGSLSDSVTTLTASVGSLTASVTQTASAVATLEGYASSTFVLRVGAGGAAAGLEIVAADDPSGPASSIKLDAVQVVVPGSITAELMDVAELSAISATLGTFQTAPSGERTVIDDDGMRVYDENGVLRAEFGRLS